MNPSQRRDIQNQLIKQGRRNFKVLIKLRPTVKYWCLSYHLIGPVRFLWIPIVVQLNFVNRSAIYYADTLWIYIQAIPLDKTNGLRLYRIDVVISVDSSLHS